MANPGDSDNAATRAADRTRNKRQASLFLLDVANSRVTAMQKKRVESADLVKHSRELRSRSQKLRQKKTS